MSERQDVFLSLSQHLSLCAHESLYTVPAYTVGLII